jgi:signal transduction histidine kinase
VGEIATEAIAAVASIKAVPTILDIICRTTGMRFAAVARVTEQRWIACSVQDDIAFGLQPGGELDVESTLCHEVRGNRKAIVIDHVAEDPQFRNHHTPARYALQSYISMPITLADGSFFGTLCAIDPEPHVLKTPETITMFEMFADVIGFQLSAIDKVANTEARLREERQTSALREQFIAVLGHDLRNPLTGILGGMEMLQKNPLNERAAQWAQMVVASAGRLAELTRCLLVTRRNRSGWRRSPRMAGLKCRSPMPATPSPNRCWLASLSRFRAAPCNPAERDWGSAFIYRTRSRWRMAVS